MKHSKSSSLLKTTTDRREYLRIITYRDPWDDRDRFIINRVNRGRVGYWKKKGIYPALARSYRTWKHNRKTQYKLIQQHNRNEGLSCNIEACLT